MRKITTLLLTISIILCMTTTALANSITYYRDADEFVVSPNNGETPTELFSGFSNIMPGSTYYDEILVKNDASNEKKYKVYLKSYGSSTASRAFLSYLNLTVKTGDGSTIFDEAASEPAQLKDWVYLGTLAPGENATLNLVLNVSGNLGNSYEDETGYLKWAFMVEEYTDPAPGPEPKPEPDPDDEEKTRTGDTQRIFMYSALCLTSVLMIYYLLKSFKRGKEK